MGEKVAVSMDLFEWTIRGQLKDEERTKGTKKIDILIV